MNRKPLRWRYCAHCGFGGGLGRVRSPRRTCKNIRCKRFGSVLEIGSMADADRIRLDWWAIPGNMSDPR